VGGGQTGDVDDVFDRDRHSMQQAGLLLMDLDLHVSHLRRRECTVSIYGNEGTQGWVEPTDALEVLARELERRHFFAPNGLRLFNSVQPDHLASTASGILP